MRKKLLFFLLMPLLFIGCSKPGKNIPQPQGSFPLTITDAFEEEVTIEKPPVRIISLAPSHTEILFQLDLEEEIVGVTNWCNWPGEAQKKTLVGDINLNFEKIVSLKPDLIVGIRSMQEENLKRLAQMGYKVLSLEPAGIEGTIKTIETLGLVTDRRAEAGRLIAKIKEQLASIKPKTTRPKVLMVLDLDPLYTVGPGSLQDELLVRAGGENIAAETNTPWPQLSDEIIIAQDPDVILVTADFQERILNKAAWRNLKAVKKGAIYSVDPDLISRPGPRIGEAALEMARVLGEK